MAKPREPREPPKSGKAGNTRTSSKAGNTRTSSKAGNTRTSSKAGNANKVQAARRAHRAREAGAANPARGRSRPENPKAAPSASSLAYSQLREEIIACARPPGERLTESDVAEQMRLGKTPVREALRQLVHEGLVLVHPRRGYIVAPVTLRDVEDLCGLRLIVEPAAVALAAGRLDDECTATLARWCRVGYEVADPASVREFHMANRAFHTTIARACGNPRLAALIDQLLVESQRLIQFGMLLQPHSEDAVHSHEALFEALREGNAAAARRIVAQEIRDTQRMVVEGLLRNSTLRTLAVALP